MNFMTACSNSKTSAAIGVAVAGGLPHAMQLRGCSCNRHIERDALLCSLDHGYGVEGRKSFHDSSFHYL
jgi:hypothetical protein